ncbi:MAG: hypothetical protein GX491_03360 [Chloroflexi bacterium]|nr:hypothetical protein [Chloroflexota bacterium]
MNRQMIKEICQQVYKRFPQVAGCEPKAESRPEGQTLLIFQGASKTADGRSIAHTIRVLVSTDGKILRMTTSK